MSMFTGLVKRVKEQKTEFNVGDLVSEEDLLQRKDVAFIRTLPAYQGREAHQYMHNDTGTIILVYGLNNEDGGRRAYIGLVQNPQKPAKYNSRERFYD